MRLVCFFLIAAAASPGQDAAQLLREGRFPELVQFLQQRIHKGLPPSESARLELELADAFRHWGRFETAAQHLDRAASLDEPSSPLRLRLKLLQVRGIVFANLGRMSEGESSLRRAQELAVAGQATKAQLGHILMALGELHLSAGLLPAAREELVAAQQLLRDSDSVAAAWTSQVLCDLESAEGSGRRAEKACQDALRMIPASDAGPLRPAAWTQLGIIAYNNGDPASAAKFWKRAIALNDSQAHLRASPAAAAPLANLGELLRAQGKCQQAIPLLERAVRLAEVLPPADQAKATRAMTSLGRAVGESGDLDRGSAILLRALSHAETVLGSNQPLSAVILNSLGALQLKAGRPADAENSFSRAAAMLAGGPPPFAAHHIDALRGRALALRKLRRAAEAELLESQAREAAALLPGRHTVSITALRTQ